MAAIEIKLWGESVRLNSDQDAEFIQQVADYLNGKMAEISKDKTVITTKTVALRAAFMIAAEYMLMQRELEKLETTVIQVTEDLKLTIE